eukprot:TRINITY_DN6220_c0_g1_i2.p1 TRINITY_DN6220_c0_g1~~TRINITY_DN6220_c0_g1_i2.p1  ORF type:complete len:796 (+),score=193.42 TRINITY_DN6220_c0_g1_i2:54-2441(+)
MAQAMQLSDAQQAVKQQCRDFFRNDEEGSKKYAKKVENLLNGKNTRLIMDIQDLHAYGGVEGEPGSDLGHQILLSPQEYLRFLDEALQEVVDHKDYVKHDINTSALHVGLEGYFGRFQVSPRELGAWHLNKLVCLDGVVTRTSANIAKITKSVHWNESKNSFMERSYRDQLSAEIDDTLLPTVNIMPKRDIDNNILRTEHGLCTYTDMQTLVLQERPEKAPVGSLPRSVEVRLENDLVDKCKPGDRAKIIGIYMPYTQNGKEFCTILVANHIILIDLKEQQDEELLEADVDAIKMFSKKENIFDMLSSAVAPSIFGHRQIKEAIVLMMLGGVEHDIDNHHHIRGDIHLLLVGEPATAKSQLLRFVMKLAPFSLSTTGKGSSGVGLTGAVVVDPDTGEKSLAAGAMVLADRGVLCIDEFDKMSDADRVAMHEAMEQGSVTIAKAGIQATLNGRCSVVAAANPVYGFYAVTHSVAFNIGLPESLLSRFDLLFIVLDDKSSQWTRNVADHVLQNHRTGLGITIGTDLDNESAMANSSSTQRRVKQVKVYHTNNPYETGKKGKAKKLITVEFLRMYLQYAKRMKPQLSEEAREKIEEHWLTLRKEQTLQENEGTSAIYINPRTLECLVRLSTAHAKCRLSKIVEEDDVDVAIRLLRHAVNARTEAVESRKMEKKAMEGGEEEDKELAKPTPAEPSDPEAKRRKKDTASDAPSSQPKAPSTEQTTEVIKAATTVATSDLTKQEGQLSLSSFLSKVKRLLLTNQHPSWPGRDPTEQEIQKTIQVIQNEGLIMVVDGVVFIL